MPADTAKLLQKAKAFRNDNGVMIITYEICLVYINNTVTSYQKLT